MSLLDVYGAAVQELRNRAVGRVVAAFGPDAISDAGVAEFIRAAVPVVIAGMRQTAAATDAYLTRDLAERFGERIVGDQVIDVRQGLRGVPMNEVYARPTHTVRYALSQGKPVPDAVAAGKERLTKMVQSDLQIAKTNQARATLRRSTIDGYERVLKGEQSCIKCILASTRFYTKAELMPIHPGCDCDVRPARKLKNRSVVLNADRLDAIKKLIRKDKIAAGDYSKVLVVHDHGELGPVLGLDGESFRSEVQAADDRDQQAQAKTDAKTARQLLPGLEASLKNLRAKGLPEDSPQIQYHLEIIAKLRGDIARRSVSGPHTSTALVG